MSSNHRLSWKRRLLTLVLASAPLLAVPAAPIELGDEVAGEVIDARLPVEYSFNASAGQHVFVERLASSNTNGLNWSLVDRWNRTVVESTTSLAHLGPVRLVGGEYRLSVFSEASGLGTFSFRVLDAMPTETPLDLDTSVDGSIESPGRSVSYALVVPPSTRLFVDFSNVTGASTLNATLEDALGRVIVPRTSSLADLGPLDLLGGEYRLTIQPENAAVGAWSLTAHTVEDSSGSVTIGSPLSDALTVPGQKASYSVLASEGQLVSVEFLSTSNLSGLNWRLLDARGRAIESRTNSLFDRDRLLLHAGEHTLEILGEGDSTGSFELVVHDVVDTTRAISIGDEITGSIDVPGERQHHDFIAAAGQLLRLDVLEASPAAGLNWQLTDRLGREVLTRTTSLADVGPLSLAGGEYRLTLLGESGVTGDYRFTLVDDGTTAFTPNGTPLALAVEIADLVEDPGGEKRYTLALAEGERLFVDILSNGPNIDLEILDPAGERVHRGRASSATGGDAGPFPLAAGTYTLVFDAPGTATPSYHFRALTTLDELRDVTVDTVIEGSFAGRAGSVDTLRFEASAGQALLFDTQVNASGLSWTLTDPLGRTVFGPTSAASASADQGPHVLDAGTHSLLLDPGNSTTPDYRVRLTSVVDTVTPIALDTLVEASFVGTAGSTQSYAFEVLEGERIFCDRVTNTSNLDWTLIDPIGEPVFGLRGATAATRDEGPFALRSGTYTLVFDARHATEPDYDFRVWRVVDSDENLVLGALNERSLASGGARAIYRLDAIEGQRIFLDIRHNTSSLVWTLLDPVGVPVFADASANRAADSRGPITLTAGEHRLELRATDGELRSFSFVVEDRARDLVVNSLEVSPATISTSGDRRVAIRYTVRNDGGGPAITSDWIDRLVFSLDEVLGNADDVLVAEIPHDAPLEPRASYQAETSFEIPAGLVGAFRVFLTVDHAETVDEVGGEANNVASAVIAVLPETDASRSRIEFDLADGTAFPVGAAVALSGRATAVGSNAAVLYILDTSLSTADRAFDANFDGIIDENDDIDGDGGVGEILDAEIGSLLRVDELIAGNVDSVHAAIFFACEAAPLDISPRANSQVFWGPFDEDHDQNGLTDFEESVKSLRNSAPTTASLFSSVSLDNGCTSFNAAIAAGREFLPLAGPVDQRVVIFLTDGESTDPADEALFLDFAAQELTFRAFQINSRDVTPSLQSLADTIDSVDGSTGSARSVDDAGDLLFEIVNSFRVVAVNVDGVPADRVDAAGRFFDLVTIDSVGDNFFTVEVFDASGGSFSARLRLRGVESTGDSFDQLVDVTSSMSIDYSRTTFNERTSALNVQAEACNSSSTPIDGPVLMVIDRVTEASVSIGNPDGFTPDGKPYFLFVDQTVLPTLDAGACTPRRALSFQSPRRQRVDFDARWLALGNHPPRFESIPPVEAIAGRPYRYDASAIDPDGHAVSYSLEIAPDQMTIDDSTGTLLWSPSAGEIGTHAVTVTARDGRGGVARQSYALDVVSGLRNRSPFFTSTPPTRVAIGARYVHLATASDADGDALSFSKLAGPDALLVEPDGSIFWAFATPGEHPVSIRVEDGRGGAAEQTWLLTAGDVSSNPNAPRLFGTPSPVAAAGSLYFYQPAAEDPDPGEILRFDLPLAPDGMEIDPESGRVTWIPELAQLGSHPVTLRVADSAGASTTQSWDIEVLDAPANRPPFIESTPGFLAFVGSAYEYRVLARDPDAQLIMYELPVAPDGMTMDASGRITWTPPSPGVFLVGIRVTDPLGATGSQVYELVVEPPNRPPEITSNPVLDAIVGGPYRYDVDAQDPDGHPLVYSLESAPAGMAMDSRSGVITWTPGVLQVGVHAVRVAVQDGRLGIDRQDYDVTVAIDTAAPEVELLVSRDPARVGEELEICVLATDDVGVASRVLRADDTELSLDARGCVRFQPQAPGRIALTAVATDSAGNEGVAGYELLVVDPTPSEAPTVTLDSPAANSLVTALVDIVATIDDDTPATLSWTVSFARAGTDEFRVIGSGSGAVSQGVVARFDPTTLPNDIYRVRIVASDGTQTGGLEFDLSVSGALKLGQFAIEFIDVQVPLFSIPLAVLRRYDSLDLSEGDFGPGWRLGGPGNVVDSPIESKTGSGLVDLLSNEPFRAGARVYVTLPEGRRVGFTFEPRQRGFPTPMLFEPSFIADGDSRDRLEVVEPAGSFFYLGGFATQIGIPYNPSRYRLTTESGFSYIIGEETGLERIEDRAGNFVDVRDDGYFSSAGVDVLFERDADGRITRVVEPAVGKEPAAVTRYSYDEIGNLVAVENQLGATQRFFYEAPAFPHLLTRIEDPLGQSVRRMVYDEEGRVVAMCSSGDDFETLEGCRRFDRDIDARISTVFDGRGNRTDLFFDELGRITREWRYLDGGDVLETIREYDATGNLILETDPAGNTNSYTYDARGNQTSRTDPAGRTWTWMYNDCDEVVEECDPLGNCVRHAYDEDCNLLWTEDSLGARRTFTYGELGQRLSMTDAGGNTWTYEYDEWGYPSEITDPFLEVTRYEFSRKGDLLRFVGRNGREVTFAYDARRRLMTETWNTVPPRVATYTYDDIDRLVRAEDPDSVIAIEYWNARDIRSISNAGTPGAPEVTLTYGDADGLDYFQGYDGLGNLRRVSDSLGGYTEYELDELNRVTSIRQGGTGVAEKRVDRSLDAAGRLLELSRFADLAGTQLVARTHYEYDCGTCSRTVTLIDHRDASDAEIHRIALTRNAAGDVLRAEDAEGLHDYVYDGVRRLLSADQPAGLQPDESYSYDLLGNREASHLGDDTLSEEISGVGSRLVEDAGFTYVYDAEGNVVRRTRRASGEYDTFEYDHRNRLVAIVSHDAKDRTTREVRYAYDLLDRRIRETIDGVTTHFVLDRHQVALELDAKGNVLRRRLHGIEIDDILASESGGETRWYLKDALGSVRDVLDNDGEVLAHHVYDSFGRLLSGAPDPADPVHFQGRELDPETGLYYFRARYYSPATGRFLAEDPRDPFLHDFAMSNPLAFGDPTGETALIEYACEIASAVSIIGGVTSFGEPFGDVLRYLAETIQNGEPSGPPGDLIKNLVVGTGKFILSLFGIPTGWSDVAGNAACAMTLGT